MDEIGKCKNREFNRRVDDLLNSSSIPKHDMAVILLAAAREQFADADEHREHQEWFGLVEEVEKEAEATDLIDEIYTDGC